MSLYQGKYRVEPTRLRDWDYRSRGWNFVTICTRNRARIFGEVVRGEMNLTALGHIVESELQNLPGHYDNVQVDAHVVMPNHVHAVIMIDGDHAFTPNPAAPALVVPGFSSPQAGSLSVIIRSYKAGVTRQCRRMGLQEVVWQARFHDHLLRGEAIINAVREYIRNNPAKWAEDKENRA